MKTPDGEEFGPYNRLQLVELFEREKFTYHCRVRNPLVNRWNDAEEIKPLKKIVQAQRERDEAAERERAVNKLKAQLGAKREDGTERLRNAQIGSVFSFTPAPIHLRVLAGMTDLLVALVWGGLVAGLGAGAIQVGFQPMPVLYFGFFLFVAGVEVIRAWSLGFGAQTFGQWFWGVMIVGMKGQPVLLFRAFVFGLSSALLGLLTPLVAYLLPSRRALPDMIARVRVVRIRVEGRDTRTVPR